MSSPANTLWDVIVIGTGIGGGTIGRALSEQGLKVLFVEKGSAGHRAEETRISPDPADPVARHIRGFWPTPLHARINGKESAFFGPVGSGLGGSSTFYAATLERPEPHDLDHSPARPHPTGGWPIAYQSFHPWIEQAEALYHICGEADPLSDQPADTLAVPPAVQAGDAALMARMRGKGLHPYRLHSAIRYLEGCQECLGHKCPRPCKMDGRSAGVEPALLTGNAILLDNCNVQRLAGSATQITDIVALHNGTPITLRAKTVVLAAGALGSPRLLLNSSSEHWPDGCANASGLVGRNLMFHLNEMFALWPQRGAKFDGPTKSIGFRDLYLVNGERFGMVQAMGLDASYGEIVHYLKSLVARSWLRHLPLLGDLTRLPAMFAARILGNAKVFVGLMEDLPYPHNRVVADPDHPDQIAFEYTYSDEMLRRRRAFRKQIHRALRGQRHMFLTFQPELNFGHPCGTLRFGNDPKTSVLNAECRSHDLENLYVVDASFMPTSTGVNPSLTIAANALRVAEKIIAKHRETKVPHG